MRTTRFRNNIAHSYLSFGFFLSSLCVLYPTMSVSLDWSCLIFILWYHYKLAYALLFILIYYSYMFGLLLLWGVGYRSKFSNSTIWINDGFIWNVHYWYVMIVLGNLYNTILLFHHMLTTNNIALWFVNFFSCAFLHWYM